MRLTIIAALLAASPLTAQEDILGFSCKDVLEAITAPGDMEAEIMMFRGIEGVAEANKFAGLYSGIAYGYITAKTGGPRGTEWIDRCKAGDEETTFGEVLQSFDGD